MSSSRKAVIIGAGPAGLTAAYELLKRTDIKPIVLEAEALVGGIARTVEHAGNRMDIGGHRFFTKSDEVEKLWLSFLPPQGKKSYDDLLLDRDVDLDPNGPDPEKTDVVMLRRGRVSRIYFRRKFFDYPISLSFRTFKNLGFRLTMKAGFGYLAAKMRHRKKADNLEDFYVSRFGRPLYETFFASYTEKLWGRPPKEIDASWGAQRVKGLSLSKVIREALLKPFRKKKGRNVETSLIESFWYPKLGPGELYQLMADKIISLGGEVRLKSEVRKINGKDGRLTSVELADGTVIEGDYFISSMPIKDLVNDLAGIEVSEDTKRIASGLIYRDFMTLGLLVRKIDLVNETKRRTLNDLPPDTWIYVQEKDVKLGRIQIFNNWSPYLVKDPLTTVWIGLEYFVNENDELWRMKDEDFLAFALTELRKIGVLKDEKVLDSHLIRVKKAYPAYFGTYHELGKVVDFLDSLGNLYCVGRNGQHRYNNMDHSMLTAMRAVDTIIDPERHPKADIWKVNTEQSYHEEKEKKDGEH